MEEVNYLYAKLQTQIVEESREGNMKWIPSRIRKLTVSSCYAVNSKGRVAAKTKG